MKSKQWKSLVAMLLAASFALSACGGAGGNGDDSAEKPAAATEEKKAGATDGSNEDSGSAAEELTVAHYFVDELRNGDFANDVFNTLKENWISEHPDIKLNETILAHDDYQTKIQAQAAVGELPDVFLVKGSWVKNFVESDLLKPLDSFIDGYEHKDQYREGMFDSATYQGTIYAHPSHVNVTSVVFYNEQMWKEIGYDTFPATWAELTEAAKKFEEKGISAMTMGNRDAWVAESCLFSAIGDSYTGTDWTNSIVAHDGKASFNDANFVSALAKFQEVAQAGVFNPDFNTISDNQSQEYYCQGKAAAMSAGNWAVGYVETNSSEEILSNTKMATLPGADGGEGKSNVMSVGCGWFFAVNNNLEGEKLEAAMDFIFSTTGYENSKMITEKYGQTGAFQVDNPDMSALTPLQQIYVDLLSKVNSVPVYDLCMDGAVIEVMNSGLQTLLNGSLSPEDLAAQIQAEQEKASG